MAKPRILPDVLTMDEQKALLNIFNQRSGVSLPFSDFCQPVITGKIVPAKIVETIIGHAKKLGWNYIQNSITGEAESSKLLVAHPKTPIRLWVSYW